MIMGRVHQMEAATKPVFTPQNLRPKAKVASEPRKLPSQETIMASMAEEVKR